MKGKENTYAYKGARLHYLLYEGGPEILICFHGYGQQAEYFQPLAERLQECFTVYAFDLFYHGQSKWPDCEVALTGNLLTEMMLDFLKSKGITRLSLCGYSLGGKVAMCLAESLAPRLNHLILIAPDGIKTNFWYSMATYPYWMRRLFKFSISRPAFYFKASKLLGRLRIVDKGVIKFAKYQMNTAAKREKVYCNWLTYRGIVPHIHQLKNALNTCRVKTHIFLGSYDRIIKPDSISTLTRHLNDYTLHQLPTGHNTLIRDVANFEDTIV